MLSDKIFNYKIIGMAVLLILVSCELFMDVNKWPLKYLQDKCSSWHSFVCHIIN